MFTSLLEGPELGALRGRGEPSRSSPRGSGAAQSPVTTSRSASITGLPASSTPTSTERLTQMFSMHSNHGVGLAMVKATGTIQDSWLIAGSETVTWTSSPTKTHQPVAVVSVM